MILRRRKSTLALAIAATVATFASCAPSTPQARIEIDPARYGRLSNADKSLVDQGKIRTGMDADAVYLAWGKPDSVSKGGTGNASIERWTYAGHTPVWTNDFGYGYGYGRRGYGRRGYGRGYGRVLS